MQGIAWFLSSRSDQCCGEHHTDDFEPALLEREAWLGGEKKINERKKPQTQTRRDLQIKPDSLWGNELLYVFPSPLSPSIVAATLDPDWTSSAASACSFFFLFSLPAAICSGREGGWRAASTLGFGGRWGDHVTQSGIPRSRTDLARPESRDRTAPFSNRKTPVGRALRIRGVLQPRHR